LLVEDLLLGTHHVRLVCGEGRARVYTVALEERTEHLRIDHALDASLYSRPMIWLRASAGDPRLGGYGRLLTSVLQNTHVVLVHAEDDALVLRRLLPADAPAARAGEEFVAVSIPGAASTAVRLEALTRLGAVLRQPLAAAGAAGSQAAGRARASDAGARPASRHDKAGRRAGSILLALGGAAVITSLALHLRARALRAEDAAGYNAFLEARRLGIDKYDHPAARIGTAGMFVGLAASLGWSGFAFFIMDRFERGDRNVGPMLALTAAGGVALAAGLWQLGRMDDACETCRVARDNRLETGLPLMLSGVALLTVPVSGALAVYLPDRFRRRRRAAQRVHLRPGLGALSLEGSF
jgi:hypothetical protein